MSKKTKFQKIEDAALEKVQGGAARVAATSKSSDLDSKLTTMLSQIGDSIKEVAKPQQDNSMTTMMMMMMMMGGGGGGGSAPAAAAPPPPQGGTYVKVNVRR
ncbi:MAG TPA: hypothetical protein VMZ53_32280 [Kofleriaceae bacterium]|nr:hypothetical protein [Kofleriaceae bacterium]